MKIRVVVIPLLCLGVDAARAEEPLSFNRDIRPILSDKCFACHGPDKNTREADLRLDDRDAAIEMEAIVPGDLKASEVYWRIVSEDENELMPPADSHKSLTEEEKKRIVRWIEEGAPYQAHWAYLPVKRPTVDAQGSAAVDALVNRPLVAKGLTRSSRAPDHVLLRRLHFDLTGLPPSPQDLVEFRDTGIEPYVDKLLASPHFGERMAIEWLDAVRYADTAGYHGDQPIEVSPFRDWVIGAFNENKPFDEFTIEQIAGDLLPDATLEQRVAAAYNRLGQTSNEGGIQDAEYIAKYQAERVRTTATAWLGATLACAECHDHKFDPYTAQDFYEFAAYFSDILEKGAYTGDGDYQEDPKPYEDGNIRFTNRGPMLPVPSEEEKETLAELRAEVASAEQELRKSTPELENAALSWAEEIRAQLKSGEPIDYLYLSDRGEKNEVDTKGFDFVDAKKGPVHEGGVARKQQAEGLVQHIANASKNPIRLAEGDHLFAYVWLDPKNPPSQVMLQFHHKEGGWSHRAWWGRDEIPFGKGKEGPSHRNLGALPALGEWARLEVPIAELGLVAGDELTQLAFTQFGGLAYWDSFGLRTTNEQYRLAEVPEAVRPILEKSTSDWSPEDRKVLFAHYRTIAPELAPQRAHLASLQKNLNRVSDNLRTVPATISAKRREVRILPRGNWMDKTGEIVAPGTPHFLPGPAVIEEGVVGTRLDLARWIASPENPLTSRTFVNRLWARFFGSGISGVLDDLGSQGTWPTHPELLDWLAAEFVENGWDVKHLVRTIVLSETYAQKSDAPKALVDSDPYNHLLARQSAIRLPAELVRDNALAVSGLLNPTVGGASAKPYQPVGYYQHLNFPRREYEPDNDANQYRRGVYTHWQRTFLHPAMKAFDAPSREECTMERESSTTPLQSLVLLNDPSFVEAAKALAAAEGGVAELFERVLTRPPNEEERAVLESLYAGEKERFASDRGAAESLLGVGAKKVLPDDLAKVSELAARTSVARAVLNLHESLIRY